MLISVNRVVAPASRGEYFMGQPEKCVGQQCKASRLSTERLEHLLWTARSTGARLILPRRHDPAEIALLTELGLVCERLGHLVLTPKGQERRRSCAQAHWLAMGA
jgi:hypothetical protein